MSTYEDDAERYARHQEWVADQWATPWSDPEHDVMVDVRATVRAMESEPVPSDHQAGRAMDVPWPIRNPNPGPNRAQRRQAERERRRRAIMTPASSPLWSTTNRKGK